MVVIPVGSVTVTGAKASYPGTTLVIVNVPLFEAPVSPKMEIVNDPETSDVAT